MNKVKILTRNQKIIRFFFLLGGSVSILWSLYFVKTTITMPYPLEFREGASQVMTQMFLDGKNPYSFENQPLAYNVYSFSYSMVVFPFAKLLGNTLHVHRLVTFGFIFFSSFAGAWVLYRAGRSLSSALTCGAFIMIGGMALGGLGSSPSSMGMFLFLAAILIPFTRNFDRFGLHLSLVFTLFGFFTKMYFVLSFGIVASYLFLFVSKKKGVLYAASFLILLLLSTILARIIFPLYFINAINGNISNTFRTFENLYLQLWDLLTFFFPILILTIFMLRLQKKQGFNIDSPMKSFNLIDWDKPVLEYETSYPLYAFICSFLAYVVILGSHVGNYLNYAYQMVIPTFFIWFFMRFEMKNVLPVIVVVFNLIYWQFTVLQPQMLEQRMSPEWEKLYSYLEPNEKVLNTSIITSRLVEMGITAVDSGQTNYYYLMIPYAENPLFSVSYEDFYEHGQEYAESINNSIRNREYDLIITAKDVDIFYDLNLVEEYYSLTKNLILYMPQTNQKWVVYIWKPKK